MRLPVLQCSLSQHVLEENLKKIKKLTIGLKSITTKVGTDHPEFDLIYRNLYKKVKKNKNLSNAINTSLEVRALAHILNSDIGNKINLTKALYSNIDNISPKPSSILIESIFQHYLTYYDQLEDYNITAKWLVSSLQKKNLTKDYHKPLISDNGPEWLANQTIESNRDFENQIVYMNLNQYAEGRFMTLAKRIYFVNGLERIPANQPHEILTELEKPSLFESPYAQRLLGHKILEILIDRAPTKGIDDSWLNLIMTIGGDPRIPSHHPKYQKWWRQIDNALVHKVYGWLSTLDLRLFLEALENYAYSTDNSDLKRMFPSRKRFLEGILEKNLITNTRLYLSKGSEKYLRMNYKKEHLPLFSTLLDSNKTLIHVQIGDAHMIEGSHSCYLWIYKRLSPSAIVFDYDKTKVDYYSLTQGMNSAMKSKGCPAIANITHNPIGFYWQREAVNKLNSLGINLSIQDVLTEDDYKIYKR